MIIWLLFACRSDVVYDGTLVGNAGSGKGKLARTTGAECVNPEVLVSEMRYFDSSGTLQSTETIGADLFQEIPVAFGSPASVEMDLGAFDLNCTQNNQAQTIPFSATTVSLTMASPLEDDFYIIELGDPEWLAMTDPEIPLINGSAIFVDADGDGILSASEEQLILGEGDQRGLSEEEEDEEDDTGEE